jgi:hypothetical protein
MHDCLLNSENRISDVRNQVLCALDSEKKVKDLIDPGEFL